MAAPKFLISVLALNRLELTHTCLDSIFAHSKPDSYHLFLTDNGSTDGTQDYLHKLEDDDHVTVIFNKDNEGFIGPNNKAFARAKAMGCVYFVCLNNDAEVCEGWLEKLVAPLDADPLGALSGPEGTGCTLHPNMDGYPGNKLEYIEGSCLCAKISIVATQGALFSEYLDFIYGDDSDLSLRMREAGYNIYQVPFRIKHVQCATTHDPAVKERCKQAQQHNHAVGMKRWAFYLKNRHFQYPLVVKRKHAIGDVLLTTPVIAALKAAKPEREIWVETDFPEVFQNNPHVARAGNNLEIDDTFPALDLNGSYEKRTEMRLGDCYMLDLGVRFPKTLGSIMESPRLYPSAADMLWAKNLASVDRFSPQVCVMHADPSGWPGKSWPIERYEAVAAWLVSLGWHVVAVGLTPPPPGFHAFSLIGKTSILQLAAFMKSSQLFIGGDSAPMHAALAMGCPTVALFGVTQSRYIAHGNGPRQMLDAPKSIPCAGLRHRVADKEHISCSPDCINSHSIEDVKAAIERLGVL